MTAARMALRPMLFIVRQEGKRALGDALMELMAGHLNADIVGSLDDFVEQSQGNLKEALAQAAILGEQIILDIASGLGALVAGTAVGVASPVSAPAGSRLVHDPTASIDNYLRAAFDAYKAAGKGMTSAAVSVALGTRAKLAYWRRLRACGNWRHRCVLKSLNFPIPAALAPLKACA